MNKYTHVVKEIANNFSYQQFIELLKELDNEIINGSINNFDPEFIHYFKQIINMVNDRYLVDNQPGTLGHMLVENALLNKERLTPTLAMCFILEQKANLGLDTICNEINFSHLNPNSHYRMMITNYHDIGHSNYTINWASYLKPKENADVYNYAMMFDVLHELTHVYQLTRIEQTDNSFDKLVYYDYQKDSILIKNCENNENIIFHQSLLSEFMADEQAHVFMLQLVQNHPEYFNDELIQKEKTSYQCRKNGTYGNYGANPREAFAELISDFQKAYENYPNEPSVAFIKPMLEEIEFLNQKSKPLIMQLQAQGISERGWDSYYSIYLKSIYKFDGENIILANVSQNKTSKGI